MKFIKLYNLAVAIKDVLHVNGYFIEASNLEKKKSFPNRYIFYF